MARRRKSSLQKALHAMAPHRVLWRALSGPEVASAIRSKTRTQTVRVNAQSRQAQVQRAAKKAAAKRDPYAAARQIPEQNRKIAAKQAAAAKKATAPKKQVPVRGKGGRFDGSKVMSAPDAALYQQAFRKADTPPPAVRWTGSRRPPAA